VKADANRRRGVPSEEGIDWSNPQLGTRAVREYLQALEEEGQIGTTPKNISLTDPGARWTAAPGCPAFFAYSTNYLVDIHAGVIVDVEATAAHRIEENEATKTMIDRVEERFDLKPIRLIGDTAYGTASMLNWLVDEKQIEPHVPVWDKTQRVDHTLSSSDFQRDEQRNESRCPQGYALRSDWRIFTNPRTHITKADTIIYKSRQSECAICPMKSRCCPNTPYRKITRSIYEPARDVARVTRRPPLNQGDRPMPDTPRCAASLILFGNASRLDRAGSLLSIEQSQLTPMTRLHRGRHRHEAHLRIPIHSLFCHGHAVRDRGSRWHTRTLPKR
jgi:hypothetical protein